jgi:hypothetical protein
MVFTKAEFEDIIPKQKFDKKEWWKNYYQIHLKEIKEKDRIKYLSRIDKVRDVGRANRQNLKLDVISALSHGTNKCMWEGCTEDRIDGLTVDHKNGGGFYHYKEININIYRWLKIKDYPTEDYQILCMNHQIEKAIINGEYYHNKNPTLEQQKDRDYIHGWQEKLKWQTLSTYSNSPIPFCIICHTTYLWHLCLEHINGDGIKDRKERGIGGGMVLYSKLRKLGFPDKDKYQVMCYTCNIIKRIQNGEWGNKYGKGINPQVL